MNQPVIFILFSFVCLACIPLVAAQETGNILTDTLSNVGSWLGAIPGQLTSFATEQPVATGVIGTTGGIASIAGIGWKVASSAKSKLQGAYNSLKEQFDTVQSQAIKATDQLTAYKIETETQLTGLQSEAAKQIEAAKTQVSTATGQLSGLKDKIYEQDGMLGSLRNQIAEKDAAYKKLLAQYEERCRITAIP